MKNLLLNKRFGKKISRIYQNDGTLKAHSTSFKNKKLNKSCQSNVLLKSLMAWYTAF